MSEEYCIVTDSSSDLPAEYLAAEGIFSVPLTFSIDGTEYRNGDMNGKEFYTRMRNGAMPITSQANSSDMTGVFEKILQQGKDILFISISSELSGTFNSARLAAERLLATYRDRKIELIDSLSISAGQGLLVHCANKLKKCGATMEELGSWVREHMLSVAHFITVHDLKHLHRGGRISSATAVAGSILGIRPLICVDTSGTAKIAGIRRGRNSALSGLVDSVKKVIGNVVNEIAFISHTDCENDALFVKKLAEKEFGIKQFFINQAGEVLGAHVGPDAVIISMMVEHR